MQSGSQHRYFNRGNLTQDTRSENAGRAGRPEWGGEVPQQRAAAGGHHILGPQGTREEVTTEPGSQDQSGTREAEWFGSEQSLLTGAGTWRKGLSPHGSDPVTAQDAVKVGGWG